jgi:predicted NBD/HSP70 family sugar kinase
MSIEYGGAKCECGHNGCLEQYCSTIALQREVKKSLVDFPASRLRRNHSLAAIMKAMEAGDELATREVRRAAWFLGFGLANVVNLFNPDVITIGDDLARAGNILLDTVSKVVREHVLPSLFRSLRIELSTLEGDPVLAGIATLVVERALQSPSALERLAASSARTKSDQAQAVEKAGGQGRPAHTKGWAHVRQQP